MYGFHRHLGTPKSAPEVLTKPYRKNLRMEQFAGEGVGDNEPARHTALSHQENSAILVQFKYLSGAVKELKSGAELLWWVQSPGTQVRIR